MILSAGKNNYKDNKFSFREWSAPVLQTYSEVFSGLNALRLQGRTIKSFYAVGMGYNWTEDSIGDAIYCALEDKVRTGQISAPVPFLPEGVFLPKWAEIDRPFLVEFEDGDLFCIDYSGDSYMRIGMNTIPKDINCETNFHPNALFGSLIGKKVVSVEITISAEREEFTVSNPPSFDGQDARVKKISLVCQADGEWESERLEFSAFLDYGFVEAAGSDGAAKSIHAPDIKDVVRGFIDEKILNLADDYIFDR